MLFFYENGNNKKLRFSYENKLEFFSKRLKKMVLLKRKEPELSKYEYKRLQRIGNKKKTLQTALLYAIIIKPNGKRGSAEQILVS